MIDVLFAPHNDDETLFACYTLLRYRPHVVVVLDCGNERRVETFRALELLGLDPLGHAISAAYLSHPGFEQWYWSESNPDWAGVRDQMRTLVGAVGRVFAPAIEEGGHPHHTEVGRAAFDVFGPRIVTYYLTYTRTGGRSTRGREVLPEPGWEDLKRGALDCYVTQIDRPEMKAWFWSDDLREWVRPA